MPGSRPGALTGERVNTRRLRETVCLIRASYLDAGLVFLSHIVVIQSRGRSHFARPDLLSQQGQNPCGGRDGGMIASTESPLAVSAGGGSVRSSSGVQVR
jgi:hypothetical protein